MTEIDIKLSKWGNAQGVRIPKSILDSLGVKVGDKLNMKVEDKKIVIEPVEQKKVLTLKELFKDFDGETEQEEFWKDIKPVGKEIF